VRLDSAKLCPDSDTDACLSTMDTLNERRFTLLKTTIYDVTDYFYDKNQFEFLLPIYNCPLITVDSYFYAIQHFMWGVKLETLSIILSKADYIESEGSFYISGCQQTFNMIQEKGLHYAFSYC
jgi:hypothetical protein